MTLNASPGTVPDAVRWRERIHERAPGISGVSSRASVARSLASSARVSANDGSALDASDAPARTLKEPAVGVRLAEAAAVTPLAATENDVPDEPSSAPLNATSVYSPAPDTHSDE